MSVTDEKYLLFNLGAESYGIPVLKINEIIGMTEVIPIPKTPIYMKGIINLRGRIIPVLDLRVKFGMTEKEPDAQTCIIIVSREYEGSVVFVGLLVDKVAEVVNISSDSIDLPPQFGQPMDEDLFTGVGKVKGLVVMLLNIETVLTGQDIIMMNRQKQAYEMAM